MNIFKLYNTYLIKNFDEGGVIEPPEPGIYPLSAITENISPFYEQGYELYNSKIKNIFKEEPLCICRFLWGFLPGFRWGL